MAVPQGYGNKNTEGEKASKNQSKQCFVIAPIGAADSETRKRSDQVLKYIIEPPLKELGYETTRADKISEPGMISGQILQFIEEADLVIADLTERNPNVFYEIAFRHLINKPFIHLIQDGENIPFDVFDLRAIHFNHKDLDSVDRAKTEIKLQIEAIEKPDFELTTPFSNSINLEKLQNSENSEGQAIGQVVEGLHHLIRLISNSNERLDRLENLQQIQKPNYLGMGSSDLRVYTPSSPPEWIKYINEFSLGGKATGEKKLNKDTKLKNKASGNLKKEKDIEKENLGKSKPGP